MGDEYFKGNLALQDNIIMSVLNYQVMKEKVSLVIMIDGKNCDGIFFRFSRVALLVVGSRSSSVRRKFCEKTSIDMKVNFSHPPTPLRKEEN